MLVDTQRMSHYFKDDVKIENRCISSITAKELFEMYDKKKNNDDKYYIPIIPHYKNYEVTPELLNRIRQNRRPSKNRCDKLLIDFNKDHQSLVEYGSKSVSYVINKSHYNNFKWSTSHLAKPMRDRVRSRYNYLLDQKVTCLPLDTQIVSQSMEILFEFTKLYSLKNDFRNSFNDMLILATAIHHRLPLLTDDSLLARFSADRFGGSLSEKSSEVIVDFRRKAVASSNKLESKGYINRGWRIAVHNSTVNKTN